MLAVAGPAGVPALKFWSAYHALPWLSVKAGPPACTRQVDWAGAGVRVAVAVAVPVGRLFWMIASSELGGAASWDSSQIMTPPYWAPSWVSWAIMALHT